MFCFCVGLSDPKTLLVGDHFLYHILRGRYLHDISLHDIPMITILGRPGQAFRSGWLRTIHVVDIY